jgi:hypothetical protein
LNLLEDFMKTDAERFNSVTNNLNLDDLKNLISQTQKKGRYVKLVTSQPQGQKPTISLVSLKPIAIFFEFTKRLVGWKSDNVYRTDSCKDVLNNKIREIASSPESVKSTADKTRNISGDRFAENKGSPQESQRAKTSTRQPDNFETPLASTNNILQNRQNENRNTFDERFRQHQEAFDRMWNSIGVQPRSSNIFDDFDQQFDAAWKAHDELLKKQQESFRNRNNTFMQDFDARNKAFDENFRQQEAAFDKMWNNMGGGNLPMPSNRLGGIDRNPFDERNQNVFPIGNQQQARPKQQPQPQYTPQPQPQSNPQPQPQAYSKPQPQPQAKPQATGSSGISEVDKTKIKNCNTVIQSFQNFARTISGDNKLTCTTPKEAHKVWLKLNLKFHVDRTENLGNKQSANQDELAKKIEKSQEINDNFDTLVSNLSKELKKGSEGDLSIQECNLRYSLMKEPAK